MNTLKKLIFSISLVALLGAGLAACNTVEGLGKDASAAGGAITGAAHKTKKY
jgi:predicted small secreted protein